MILWLDKETGEIAHCGWLDAYFFGLVKFDYWSRYEILEYVEDEN